MFSMFKRNAQPTVHRLSEDFAITGQVSPDQVADLAQQGYRTIICNRPDGESGGQPTAAEVGAAAEAAGMSFTAIPVHPGRVTQGDVDRFAEAIRTMPGPILAYCRTGNRSNMLMKLAQG